MTPTLEDLLQFMKNDKEERAREREKDKQEIQELISQGVKQEVKALVTPIQERVDKVENVQEDVLGKLKVMSDQIKDIKVQLVEKPVETQAVTFSNALKSTPQPTTPTPTC